MIQIHFPLAYALSATINIKTHEKKQTSLTHDKVLPISSEDTIKIISSYKLTGKVLDIKNGLTFVHTTKTANTTLICLPHSITSIYVYSEN